MFVISANRGVLTLDSSETLTSNSAEFYEIKFNFDDVWKDLQNTALIRNKYGSYALSVPASGIITIPWELLTSSGITIEVGLYGTLGTKTLTSTWINLGKVQRGNFADKELTTPTRPATPNISAERIESIEKALDGLNAEIDAVASAEKANNRNVTRQINSTNTRVDDLTSLINSLSDDINRVNQEIEGINAIIGEITSSGGITESQAQALINNSIAALPGTYPNPYELRIQSDTREISYNGSSAQIMDGLLSKTTFDTNISNYPTKAELASSIASGNSELITAKSPTTLSIVNLNAIAGFYSASALRFSMPINTMRVPTSARFTGKATVRSGGAIQTVEGLDLTAVQSDILDGSISFIITGLIATTGEFATRQAGAVLLNGTISLTYD